MPRASLVVSYTVLVSDPRIRRQIDWLTGDGRTVDTLGFGPHPDPVVQKHFTIGKLPVILRLAPIKAALHLVLPRSLLFRLFGVSRIPRALRRLARHGHYDLIVFNELELAPWVRDARIFGPGKTRAHLDLHEFRSIGARPASRIGGLAKQVAARRSRWTRNGIAHPSFTSRSTVARGISELYAEEFSIPAPAVVRNCPPFEDLHAGPVDPAEIRLLYHGMASGLRGLHEMARAMRDLPEHFSMTFMLTPNRNVIDELRATIGDQPRVRIVDPVPMLEVARAINHYDLEIIFLPPTSQNLRLALPNKFFEAVQGRLGVVTGASPMMTELIEQYGNGVVVDGWTEADLVRSLAALTPDDVTRLKQAAHRAAADLNAEREGAAFLRAIALEPPD